MPSEVKSNSMESERAIQQAICIPSWVSLLLNAAGIKHTGSGANRNSRIRKVSFLEKLEV